MRRHILVTAAKSERKPGLSIKVHLYCAIHEGILGSGGRAPQIFKHDSTCRWVVSFTSRPLCPDERSPVTHFIVDLIEASIIGVTYHSPLFFFLWILNFFGIEQRYGQFSVANSYLWKKKRRANVMIFQLCGLWQRKWPFAVIMTCCDVQGDHNIPL